MSTIKVNNIVPPNVGEGVTIDGLQMPTAGPLSNRNILVNGSCKVAQRGTSTASAVSGTTFVADRWRYEASTASAITASQSTDAPVGFTHSIKAEVTTADTTTDATDFNQFLYKIEADDISHLNYGTADAQTCTISFWVKHSLSGTYPFSIQNHDGSRVYPSFYVVNTANTWEYKTITFAGDTGGTWITGGTTLGMRFTFMWNVGSNFTGGTAGAWGTASPAVFRNFTTTTGPDINGTVGKTVQWAGVQLEVGSKATPFEHESYGQTLAKCQRYFTTSFVGEAGPNNTSNSGIILEGGGVTGATTSFLGAAPVFFPTSMRANPTILIYDLDTPRNLNKCHRHTFGVAGTNNQNVGAYDMNPKGFYARTDSGANATGFIFHYTADAEL